MNQMLAPLVERYMCHQIIRHVFSIIDIKLTHLDDTHSIWMSH
jgi:hypothetical protein